MTGWRGTLPRGELCDLPALLTGVDRHILNCCLPTNVKAIS